MSFTEALLSKADKTQQSHPRQAAAAATVAVASSQWQEAAGQSVAAPTVNSHGQGSNCTTAVHQSTMMLRQKKLTLLEHNVPYSSYTPQIIAVNAHGIGRQRNETVNTCKT
jgi:hypothetical protein